MILTVLGISLAAPAQAGTTTADFLKWEREAQESFLQISISMAGVIASQINQETAICMDEWYFGDKDLQQQRHAEILKIMPDYTTYDPHAVLMAYLESVCGKLN